MVPANDGKSMSNVNTACLPIKNARTADYLSIVNYRPKLSDSSTKSIITLSGGRKDGYDLSMTDENNGNSYVYFGEQQASRTAALIYDPSNGSFTLDKIVSEFNFNLRSTPTNNDAASLASQYPQLGRGLQESNEDEADLLNEHPEGHDPDSEPPDPKNPYDYRHFLNSTRPGRSPSPELPHLATPTPSHNAVSSPIVVGSSFSRPSHSSKPIKRRSHPRPRQPSPNPREEADADNEESEADDVLTIDMGDSTTEKNRPWRSVLGALNEGGRSSGPISLRSAASSMSPSLRGDSDVEEEKQSNADVEEIDLGDGEVDVDSQGAGVEEVDPAGMASEEDEDPFAAQLENQLIAEAMSEAEQEEQGGVRVNGENGTSTGINGVVEDRVSESSEESEEE